MNNKKSKAQFFRDNGEIFNKEKESYQTWYKKCVLKYDPEKRKQHNAITRGPALKRYHINSAFNKLCKIEIY